MAKFNDLPRRYHDNVETDAPFGIPARLTQDDIDDIVAFLKTLSDNYDTPSP